MANLYDLKQIRCKTCGEPLDLNGAVGGVIKCGVCGGCFTLPKFDASQKVLDFLFQGEHDLDTGRFEEAFAAYSKAAELDKTEPEAYLGMALAECKIQYLKDEVNNRLQPICHEINDGKFSDNKHYKKACGYATAEQKRAYADRAEEIDYIKSEFFRLKKRGVKYDCFICVKVTENSEDSEQAIKSESAARTADSEFAGRVYRLLKKRAYEPFYSETVLKNVTGADYEAHILYALATSETMLVICFDEAYLRTKWVKNEYTRFLKLVNDEEKESDSITLVYRGKPIEKLPSKNGKIQGIDADEDDWSDLILRFVESHTPEAKRKREEAAAAKAVEDEALRKRLAEQEERFKQLEEMLKNQQASARKDEEAERKEAEQTRLAEERENRERAREEAERKTAEESARMEAEKQALLQVEKERREKERREKERKEREEAERKASKERARMEAKEKARLKAEREQQERERKEQEEQARIACDFEIEKGVLKKYKGNDVEVVIPNGVSSIGGNAFHSCSGLTSITIPNSVTSIGAHAFHECSKLTSITIPSSVTSIGNYAFWSCCSGLESITVENGNTKYKSENNCLLTKGGKTLVLGCKNSIIPNSVTKICDSAFSGCNALTNVIIPNSVTSIGDSAFSGCSELTSITIPNSVTSLGEVAFNGCHGLKYVTLGNGVTRIGKEAFNCCRGLKSIMIPDSVTSVGVCAFGNCSGLTSITIPSGVTIIDYFAFAGCSGLTSINYGGSKRQWKAITKGEDWDYNTGDYTVYFGKGLVKEMKKPQR